MFATDATRVFKTLVIDWLEASGLGYDTRYHHYRAQFPELDPARLAHLVCDPIEYYTTRSGRRTAVAAIGRKPPW